MKTWVIVLIVIAVVLIGLIIALYFLGKRAQKKQQEEKVRQIQQELKKKQTQRKLRDRRIVREGEEADQEIRRLKSYLSHMENTQENLHAVSGAETGGGDFLGETAVSAEQIAVSEPVAF